MSLYRRSSKFIGFRLTGPLHNASDTPPHARTDKGIFFFQERIGERHFNTLWELFNLRKGFEVEQQLGTFSVIYVQSHQKFLIKNFFSSALGGELYAQLPFQKKFLDMHSRALTEHFWRLWKKKRRPNGKILSQIQILKHYICFYFL
jgi:hypothetical protein